jgi:hypothetical protein
MRIERATLEKNLASVEERINDAAGRVGRDAAEVALVAVTKAVDLATVRDLYDLGLRHFGENRIPEATTKIAAMPEDVTWHMIGNVQRRKARLLAEQFQCFDALDRIPLAETLARRCEALNRTLPVLIEVNASGETSKHGFTAEELPAAVEKIAALGPLQVSGLMTMAPFVEDSDSTRPVFVRLRKLADALGLPERSMGMSNDFEVAVEEGATQVRIGATLYKAP